jgi:hypothetical protein
MNCFETCFFIIFSYQILVQILVQIVACSLQHQLVAEAFCAQQEDEEGYMLKG